MPRPRTAMRKIREVLRLHLGEGLSPRQVAASLSLPRITVRRYLERAHLAGVVWPLPRDGRRTAGATPVRATAAAERDATAARLACCAPGAATQVRHAPASTAQLRERLNAFREQAGRR